ncbi:MAG: DUF4376 domain-containing protein [Gammaproteobacteria bacterium]
MKKVTAGENVFGPFKQVSVLSAALLCDGSTFPFTVIGEYTISDVEEGDFLPPQLSNSDLDGIWEDIKKLRDHKNQFGGFPVAGKWFHSDTFSRTQQIGLVMMGVNIPVGLKWKTMDGSKVDMTPTLAGQIFTSAATQDSALFAYAESLIAQVLASTDPRSIDIKAGWPLVFGD